MLRVFGKLEGMENRPMEDQISSSSSLNCKGRWGTTDDFTISFLVTTSLTNIFEE